VGRSNQDHAIYVQNKVYIPGHRRIETSRDVTFDEDTTFNRSRQSHSDEVHDEDPVAPRIADAEGEPSTFEEAVKKKEWKEAMKNINPS
jgi:hypothetical protein